MKLLFSGSTFTEEATFKRLLVVADEIGFMDRPSVTFEGWGTIGRESEVRAIDSTNSTVPLTAHEPPSGPVTDMYEKYIRADLSNGQFVSTFLQGLGQDDRFTSKFIQEAANYGQVSGAAIREALTGDSDLNVPQELGPLDQSRMFRVENQEDRQVTLQILLIEASIQATNALVISESTGLIPVSDDPYFCRLLRLRVAGSPYVAETPRVAGDLGIAVAKSVIPDEMLAHLKIGDILEFRREAKGAYDAWTVEIDKLAVQIRDLDPEDIDDAIHDLINTDVTPRLVEFQNEMGATRDRLFSELIKKVLTWELPSLSLAYVSSLDLAGALALFAGALLPVLTPVVDYYRDRRQAHRQNSMAYLIGLSR